MLEFIQFIVSAIILFFALSIIYPHAQLWWRQHYENGYWGATRMITKRAKAPFYVAVALCFVVLGFQWYVAIQRENEVKQLEIQREQEFEQIQSQLRDINLSIMEVLNELRK